MLISWFLGKSLINLLLGLSTVLMSSYVDIWTRGLDELILDNFYYLIKPKQVF